MTLLSQGLLFELVTSILLNQLSMNLSIENCSDTVPAFH